MTTFLNHTLTIGLAITLLSVVTLAAVFIFRYTKNKRNKRHLKEIQIKNSEIELLKNENKELENLTKQLESHSKIELNQWFENSKKVLENLGYLPDYEAQMIQEEIKKRQKLKAEFSISTAKSAITMEKIEGTYNIIGLNQNKEQNTYYGFLHLTKFDNNRINAEWVIGGEQTQKGIGFYYNNSLIINFSYEGDGQNAGVIYKGVVAYKFINNTILTGFWSEKHGNDAFIGHEEGRRISNIETISYQAKMN